MSKHLSGKDFTLTFGPRGDQVTISGPDASTVTANRVDLEYPYEISTAESWPSFFVYTREEADAHLAHHPGVLHCHHDRTPAQQWEIPGTSDAVPDIAFTDLADVLHFALVVDKAVRNPFAPPTPAPVELPPRRVSESEFLSQYPKVVSGLRILEVHGYRPGVDRPFADAIAVTARGDVEYATHVLTWGTANDPDQWNLELGIYGGSFDKARRTAQERAAERADTA